MNYIQIAVQLGLIAEQINNIKNQFTPDEDLLLASTIVHAEMELNLAEAHALRKAEEQHD